MKVSMDRFKEPTAADNLARCQNCFALLHYEELNEWGYCKDCWKDDDEEKP